MEPTLSRDTPLAIGKKIDAMLAPLAQPPSALRAGTHVSSMHCQKHRASQPQKNPQQVGPKVEVGAEASRNLKPSQASDGNTKTQRHRNPKTSWADVGNTQLRNTHKPKANASRRWKHQAPKPPKKPKPARGGVGNSKHKLTYCITVS